MNIDKSTEYRIFCFEEMPFEKLRECFKTVFKYTDEFKKFQLQERYVVEVKDDFGHKWKFENCYLYRDQISVIVSIDDELRVSRKMTHDEFFDLFAEW